MCYLDPVYLQQTSHAPVCGPACPTQDGAARVLRYLRDGSFLDDAQSASLDVRLLTYNPALDVLG